MIVPFFISHQGCPHRCVFCDQNKIAGRSSQLPTAAEIIARIDQYSASEHLAPAEVAFFGGTFTSLSKTIQESLLAPLQPLLATGRLNSVRISTRPDAVDSASAEFLRSRGVRTVELGVQSLDDEVLKRTGRGYIPAQVEEACRVLHSNGLNIGIQLMPGLPGDTAVKSVATLQRALALKPDFLRIYPALVLAGTGLESLYNEGKYRPLTLAEAVSLCRVLLHVAWQADVPVIRMGLQPTTELLAAGTIGAGPFHPAFRELVEGELCYDLLLKLARQFMPTESVTIACAPNRLSATVGQRRSNIIRLQTLHGFSVNTILPDPALSARELLLISGNNIRKGNMMTDLHYTIEDIAHAG